MVQVRALAATGALGTGFREETLRQAIAQGPDMLGCDAGSTDAGPFYLGSGQTMASPAAVRRDLSVMLREAVPAGVPVLIGSAGTGGGRPHLAGAVDMVRQIAAEHGLRFRLAVIEAEQDPERLAREFEAGRIRPLQHAPAVTADDLRGAHRIVAQMGAEPFTHALEQGADVVLAGRASDAAIYSAVPMMKGAGAGPSWHAAKILECGAASVAQRLYPDCMMADIGEDGFTVAPPNPAMACTPQSIASHTLYENADPFLLTEPSGVLDTTACRYEAVDDRTVRVVGSVFHPKDPYDVRLEGVRLAGHRFVVPAGIRDPLVLRQLDRFIDESFGVVRSKVGQSLGLDEDEYRLGARVYGRDACLGDLEPEREQLGHEVGLHLEVTAPDAITAQAVASLAWHTVLHHPIPEWNGLISNLAFPYSPPELDVGPAYEFMMNHVWELDDPLAPFPMRLEDVG
jgi:hypothetical protein